MQLEPSERYNKQANKQTSYGQQSTLSRSKINNAWIFLKINASHHKHSYEILP